MSDEEAAERLIQAVNKALDAGVAEERLRRLAHGSRIWGAVNMKTLAERIEFVERGVDKMMETT